MTRESWYVLAGTVAVSAVYWLPLAWQVVTTGRFTSLQNRFFDASMAEISLPFLRATLEGVVMAFGLVALVVLARRSRLALGLLTLLAAAYAWWILGQVAVLADSPVSAFRTSLVIEGILLAGAALGTVEGVRALRTPEVCRVAAVVAGVFGALLAVAALGAMPYVAEQRAQRVPTALLRTFDHATAGRDPNAVVLATASPLVGFRTPYLFNVWNAHYSNPTSEFARRSRFLDRLARERDPDVFAAALSANRYDRVDAVVLADDGDALTYRDYQDNFPNGTRVRDVTFDPAQFAPRWFSASGGGGYVVLTTRPGDPVQALDPVDRSELRRHFPGDLTGHD